MIHANEKHRFDFKSPFLLSLIRFANFNSIMTSFYLCFLLCLRKQKFILSFLCLSTTAFDDTRKPNHFANVQYSITAALTLSMFYQIFSPINLRDDLAFSEVVTQMVEVIYADKKFKYVLANHRSTYDITLTLFYHCC